MFFSYLRVGGSLKPGHERRMAKRVRESGKKKAQRAARRLNRK